MVSIEEARRILWEEWYSLSDEEIKDTIEVSYKMVRVVYYENKRKKDNQNEDNTNLNQ